MRIAIIVWILFSIVGCGGVGQVRMMPRDGGAFSQEAS
jgi:hypothetical protein